MKPVILIILSMTLALSGYAVYAASTPVKSSSQASQMAVASKKAPSFMFVIQAKKGEIKYNKKAAQYELVLNKADVNHVIMFSDRPYRIVKYITGTDLASDWTQGKNSYKADPPNAVLSGTGMKAEIVILKSITVNSSRMIFGLQGYSGAPIGLKIIPVTLTIDSAEGSILKRLTDEGISDLCQPLVDPPCTLCPCSKQNGYSAPTIGT